MRNRPQLTTRGLASAAVLAVAGASVGWLCVRMAMVEVLPPDSPTIRRFAADDPRVVLSAGTTALIARRGILDDAALAAVRRAALAAPLDARAFLILGHQQLLDRQPDRAVKTLEAGQRLDPRQRVIHLLLLDRYLRTARYADAATQFSVLSRLISSAQGPIAKAMAAMSLAPETRDAVRQTLRSDPRLERTVLLTMAQSDTAPDMIFALASPAARADAANKESWGPVLVTRLIERRRYDVARSVWQRIYRLSDAQVAAPIFNARFTAGVTAPPFDWVLTAGSIGAADIRDGSLAIDYYGRDSGDLATQLLVLAPGRYRFAFTADPGKTDNAAKLFWSLTCASGGAGGDRASLMNVAVTAGATKRRITADVVIPATCPAQTLTLRGEAGEFPAPTSVSVRDLDIGPVAGARP